MRTLIFLLLLLTGLAWPEGLESGVWQGPVRGKGIVSLEVQDSSFTFTFHSLAAELQTATATGTFIQLPKQEVTFHISSVKCVGLRTDELGGFDFCGWPLRPGMDARGKLGRAGGKLILEGLDSNTSASLARFPLEAVR